MAIDRRELCSLLPLALLAGAWTSDETPALASGVFRFSDLQPHANANGSGESRPVVKGATPTGEQVEVHETARLKSPSTENQTSWGQARLPLPHRMTSTESRTLAI